MSGQHAARLGAFACNNAAAELLGLLTRPYHQKVHVTCLDLGDAGAIFTRGWDRTVELVGATAKAMKRRSTPFGFIRRAPSAPQRLLRPTRNES